MGKKVVFLCQVIFLLFTFFGDTFAQEDIIVSGYVYESETDQALEGVKVVVEEIDTVSPSLTNVNGKYTLVISGLTEARVTFNKDGYQSLTNLVKLSEQSLKLDVKLEAVRISIEIAKFRSGSYIEGKVNGLGTNDFKKYKVLVYVLTDKWYIHPYAENRAGRGFANIDNQGKWRIETVWRGYQAYKVTFLLVSKEFYPPPTVELISGKEPEIALFNAIDSNAEKIIPAPEGI